MLNLSNVFQFVIHGLYYSPLPEKQFVGYGHQCSLHVALQFRYKLYAIHKEPFEKTLDMPTMSQKPITKNLIERAMSLQIISFLLTTF